jgi:hypothetical protein
MENQDSKTDQNYQYLKDHWDELLRKYSQKYVIICDQNVVGFFDTYEAAAMEAIAVFSEKGFIIHHLAEPKPLNFVFVA